ncbi:MAG TPA: hypothetical protein VGJ03_18545 [Acidimicrobiales bacterium]
MAKGNASEGRGRRRRGRFGVDEVVAEVEKVVEPGLHAAQHVGGFVEGDVLVPAWRRVTRGEPRWPVAIGVLCAIGMQLALPERVTFRNQWVLVAVELAMLAVLVAANPGRIELPARWLRRVSMALIATISAANVLSAGRLIASLLRGGEENAGPLLLIGGAIWLTNVIAFSLWYWELDRGGPVARVQATRPYADFLFPQMQSPELAPPDWEPAFVDYLYVSFTNATAFSPTDVLPLTRWTKLTMLFQSAISLTTVALVIARAVNILK